MKVAIVLNTSWNIYNFRMGLIRALQSHGHDVVAIAPKDQYTGKLIEAGCAFENVNMDSQGANPVKDFFLTFELYKIYKKVRPDVILHFTIKPNIYGTFAARLLNIPTVNNVCGLGTVFLQKGLISVIAKWMYKLAFRYPDKVLFQNSEDKDLFVNGKMITNDKCDLVPGSGIDITRFIPAENSKSREFTFLLVSRLIHDKGILEYIEAIKKLKSRGINAKFQILGAIDEKHKAGISASLIQSWVNENLVDYLGKVDDVREYIANAGCIVLPSYREGTPRTLLEGASMARPIVTTNVAGCNNVVKHNHNGYLCKIKDPSDLADKMEKMVNLSQEKRNDMGLKGRMLVQEHFDEKIVINKYLQLVEQHRQSA